MKTYVAIIAILLLTLISGCIGLFIGYNVAENHAQADKVALVTAQNKALATRDAQITELSARNVELTNQFLDKIELINSGYVDFGNKLREELKQDIYTQCKLPATGHALLRDHIKKANSH